MDKKFKLEASKHLAFTKAVRLANKIPQPWYLHSHQSISITFLDKACLWQALLFTITVT